MKRNLEFDKESGKFIRREEIEVGNAKDTDEIRQSLKLELAGIVRQVKGLKKRADEIKEMLVAIDAVKESTDPSPDPAVRQ